MSRELNKTGSPRPIRIAYLVTHPIQHQAPLLRRIAKEPGIELHVFFRSNISVDDYFDQEFGGRIKWDVPLLEGYDHDFLPAFGPTNRLTRWRPFNHGLFSRLKRGKFDILWVNGYSTWFYMLALIQARFLGIRTMLRGDVTMISRPRSKLNLLAKKIFHWALDFLVDRYLTIGKLNRAYYLAHGVKEEKLWTVGYTVDNDYFQSLCAAASKNREAFRESLALEPNRSIVLYAGKLTKNKRGDELLTAHARIRSENRLENPPYLVIVGSGRLEPELRRRVTEENIPDVHLLGFKNQSELPAFFDICDVFVLCAQQEAWGLIVNEVMNAGKPVIISTDVGCGPDLVRSGENGFILPVGEVDALARSLTTILGNPELAKRMGAASLEIINAWNFEQNVEGLLDACGSLGFTPTPSKQQAQQ